MRLDKLVSKGAGMSRKQAAAAIRAGRAQVNGVAITRPEHHCPEDAVLTLDGAVLHTGHRYLMLNKPAGVLCATRDSNAPTVLELLPPELRGELFPAGRLDKDTEGFVLLTDDGALAHRLLSPHKKVGKTYHAVLDSPFDLEAARDAFSRPMDLGDGDFTSPALLRLLEDGPQPVAELVIYEGRYHQVKRMFARVGPRVIALRRTAIGSLALDETLSPGEWRPLTEEELGRLFL